MKSYLHRVSGSKNLTGNHDMAGGGGPGPVAGVIKAHAPVLLEKV